MAAEWIAAAGAVLALIEKVIEFVRKEIEAGKMDVEELRKNPIDYFISKYQEAIKAQAEAESHLPD